jgi:hypothetical protein
MEQSDEKKRPGRPSKFTDAICEKILELAKTGKTDVEIAKAIGISARTLHYWKVRNPDFLQSLRESKGVADELVVASLFRRATGYSHPETKVFYNSISGEVIKETVMKHYPPDVTAMIFWLKNRQSQEWQDNPDASKDDVPIPQPLYAVVTSKPDATSA